MSILDFFKKKHFEIEKKSNIREIYNNNILDLFRNGCDGGLRLLWLMKNMRKYQLLGTQLI